MRHVASALAAASIAAAAIGAPPPAPPAADPLRGPAVEDQSISTLLGSAPGLVGSERSLPLHALRRTPWQVVLMRGVDRAAVGLHERHARRAALDVPFDQLPRGLRE